MNNKVTAIKYCRWCGDPFEIKSPNQKYCSPSKKNCSKEAKRESWRNAASKYRKKYRNVLQISQVYKTGTGLLSSKPHEDFDKEYVAIVKERRRLKLNGFLIGLSPLLQFTCRPLIDAPLNRGVFSVFEAYPYLLVFAVFLGLIAFGIYHE
ncbi:MAG: hypothetical protein ACPK7O_07440 [Methanobacterium sp.]